MNSLFHLAAPKWAPAKDPARLQALSACGIFATRPENDFDDIVNLAALSCQCASAMIAFADDQSLHFKSTVGANKPLLKIVADSFFIPTVQSSVYRWSQPSKPPSSGPTTEKTPDDVQFYAGVSVHGLNNQIIGVLCVTHTEPKSLSQFEELALLALGRQTERQLTLRRMIVEQTSLIEERERDIENRRQSEASLAAALSRVSLINEIGKAARSGADPASILKTAVTKLGISLGADRCYFVSYAASENRATIGPEWHADGLKSIGGVYKMFEHPPYQETKFDSGLTAVIEDTNIDERYKGILVSHGLGMRSLLRAPIVQGSEMTALGVAMTTPRQWSDEEIALVEAIAAQTRAAVETARHTLHERALLRDVLTSVTEGKLILADGVTELPLQYTPIGTTIYLDKECGLAELRDQIRTAGFEAGHTEIRTFDTMTAASEAGMNAIVHAESGIATVSIDKNSTIQIRIEDRGSGIAFADLPKATLARGYSTKATFGHGLKMILETIDRLYLLTGPTGTTVVLEQEKCEPAPIWLATDRSA